MSEVDAGYKLRDAGSYDALTGAFDRYTERFTVPVADRVIELGRLSAGHRVLDVGTGTGIVALRAAPRVAPNGQVVGVDLSEGMLEAVAQKAAAADLSETTRFERHDAENLELADASFDRVLSLYALLHFPNPRRALAEMIRVLEPGGRLVVAIGSSPPLRSVEGLRYFLRRIPLVVHERLGTWLSAPALIDAMVDEYLVETEGGDATQLAHSHGLDAPLDRLFREIGLVDVEVEAHAHLGVVEDVEEFWELQTTFSTHARKRIADASPEAVGKLKEAFVRRCERVLERGGKLVYPYAAFMATGLRKA